jgi:hypothetical protein
MLNKIYEIKLSSISIGGNYCKNFEVVFEEPYCSSIKCEYNAAKKVIVISVPPDCADSCIYANIKCLDTSDCTFCPDTERIKICPCTVDGDCQDCETCVNGLCVTQCKEGEFCKEDICIECDDENPCPDGKVCNNGVCECPPSKPFVNEAGECVECIEGTVEDCKICKNGVWVDKECKEGVCDPDTDGCVDCLKSGDCDLDNECCVDKDCECCPGYERNLVTGECDLKPECEKDSDCPECEICTDEGCVPVVCPEGFICVGGDCLPECDCTVGGCPSEGSSCTPHPSIVGKCYCLDCTGVPCDECNDTYGCGCTDGENCLPDGSCDLQNLNLEWKFEQGELGSPNGSALALALSSTVITPLDQVFNNGTNSTYRNYEFTVQISGNNNGQWYYTNGVTTQPLTSTGNTVSVTLEGLQQNLGLFALKFIDNDPCERTITIPFTPNTNLSNPLQAETNGWVALTPDNSGGCNAYTGATQGQWSLCVSEITDFVINPSSLVITTTDTIDINLAPQVGSCSKATITGCGIANGTVEVVCKGVSQTVEIPTFEVDQLCCDPYDPTCTSTGEPCDEYVPVNLPIKILPLFGTNGSGTSSEAVAIVDALELFNTGVFNINTVFNIASKMCWSSEGNPDSDSQEVVTEGNSFGIGFSNPYEYKFDYEVGTCILLGYACDIISGCNKYQGKECIDACDDFEVGFVSTNVDGEYYMIPSNFGYVTGNEEWKLDAFTNPNATSPNLTSTITPATATLPQIIGGTTPGVGFTVLQYFVDVLRVSIDSKIKKLVGTITISDCEAEGTLFRSLRGCTNPLSCNYNPDADLDDGSCENLTADVSYDCNGGGLQVSAFLNGVPETAVTIKKNTTVLSVGDKLVEGSHVLTIEYGSCSTTNLLRVDCCNSSTLNISGVSTVCDNTLGGSNVVFTVGGGVANYDTYLLKDGVEVDSQLDQSAGSVTLTTASVITEEEDYTIRVVDQNDCEFTFNFTFLCCTAPATSGVYFDDGAGANPSATTSSLNALTLMNNKFPASASVSVCSLPTFDMFLQSNSNILDGKTVSIVTSGSVSAVHNGTAISQNSTTSVVLDNSLPFTFSFPDTSSGSSNVTITYCNTDYNFTFVHDCSSSAITTNEFFTLTSNVTDLDSSIDLIEVDSSNSTVKSVNNFTTSTLNYGDIAFVNDVLYGIDGSNIYSISNTSETLLHTISFSAIYSGLVGVPGQNKLIVIGFRTPDCIVGVYDIGLNTYTQIDSIPNLTGGYDAVVDGTNLFITGRVTGVPKTYKMTLDASGDPVVASAVDTTNDPGVNLLGLVKVVSSGGVTRFLGGSTSTSNTNPSVIYSTTDIENSSWGPFVTGMGLTGTIRGMSSLNG